MRAERVSILGGAVRNPRRTLLYRHVVMRAEDGDRGAFTYYTH